MMSISCSTLLFVSVFNLATADFECLCNYHVERTVYPDMSTQAKPLGDLHEFDCKATYQSHRTQNWQAIQFAKMVGYIALDEQTKIQTCPGDPDAEDLVPATTTFKTTTRTDAPSTTVLDMNTTILPSTEKSTLPRTTMPSTTTIPNITVTYVTSTIMLPSTLGSFNHSTSPPTSGATVATSTPVLTSTFTTSQSTSNAINTSQSTAKPPTLSTPIISRTTVTSKLLPTTTSLLTTPSQRPKSRSTSQATVTTLSSLSTQSFTTASSTLTSTSRQSASSILSSSTTTTSNAPVTFKHTTQTPTTRAPQCPPQLTRSNNLKEFGSHCYEFILGSSREWQQAEDDCRSKGGHLVTIRNNAEQLFIYHTLLSLNFHGDKGVWIGLTDKDREGHWKWSSGEKVSFTSWASHQPGLLYAFEDCALFDMRQKQHGHWGDYRCKGNLFNHQDHGWVCEYKKQ